MYKFNNVTKLFPLAVVVQGSFLTFLVDVNKHDVRMRDQIRQKLIIKGLL